MRELDKDAIVKIAKGACFLGSGGGGPLSITPAIIENIFKADPHYVDLVHAEKTTMEHGKYCIQYRVKHDMGLIASTEYTKILL